jgi:sortase A
MATGGLILLFVAYQLWGTQLRTNQETTTTTTAPAPTALPPEATPAASDLPPPMPGNAVGQVIIPDIGVDYIYLEGVDLRYLQDGPGHFPTTPLPGQAGNAALAGHRTTYAAPFHRLDELAPGAPIEIRSAQGTFRYEVLAQPPAEGGAPPLGHFIVQPGDVWILDQGEDNRLTLMACHPKYSAAQRIVVQAEMVGIPAPPTPVAVESAPAPILGETLLTNDPDALWPAVAWGAVALLVGLVAWFAGRRWRRWPAYLLAVPVFAVPLFLSFENIAKLLPAAY